MNLKNVHIVEKNMNKVCQPLTPPKITTSNPPLGGVTNNKFQVFLNAVPVNYQFS